MTHVSYCTWFVYTTDFTYLEAVNFGRSAQREHAAVCLCACYEGADVWECVSLSVSLDLSN